MTGIISRCIICGDFFNSKRELRDHKDKAHRITNSRMVKLILAPQKRISQADSSSAKGHYLEELLAD